MMLAVRLRVVVGQLDAVTVQMVHNADMLAVRADNFHMLFDLCFDFFGVHGVLQWIELFGMLARPIYPKTTGLNPELSQSRAVF